MIQVSYVSRAVRPMSAESLLALLQQCLASNAAGKVTGMLLYGNQTFLQVIEGEEAVVDHLVGRIGQDPRHTDFQVLVRKPVLHRQYADWTMGFQRVTDQGLQRVAGLRDFGEGDFTVDNLRGNEAVVETLLDHFRKPHWDPLVRELDARDKAIEQLRASLAHARGDLEVACLALESITEASRRASLGEAHLQLCESILAALRREA